MAIDVVFKLLMIVVTKEARNLKGVPQVRSKRKETVRVEVMVPFC